jgi:hypothetical protein
MDSATNDEQIVLAGNGVCCPKCKTNVQETGFLVATVQYQAFTPSGGRLARSHKMKSEFRTAHCILCQSELFATIETLTGRKEAA